MLRCVPNTTKMSEMKRPQRDTVPNATKMSEKKRPQRDTVPNATKMSKKKRPQCDIPNTTSYLQNLCFPIVTVIGLDQIHLLVAVDGLK